MRSALLELDIAGRKSGGLIAAAGTLPSGTSDLVRQSVLAILFRAVNLPDQYQLAHFQLWLEDQGFFDTVKGAVEAAGKSWEKELSDLYVSPIIREALLKCDPNLASSKAQVGETLRKQFPLRTADLTSAEFLSTFQRVLKRAGKGENYRAQFSSSTRCSNTSVRLSTDPSPSPKLPRCSRSNSTAR